MYLHIINFDIYRQCTYIVFFLRWQKVQKQLPNCLKMAETCVVLIFFDGVLGGFHAYTVTEYLCHKWPRICSTCRKHFPVLSSFITYHRVFNWSNTTGATSGAGIDNPSGAPDFTPGFHCGSCCLIFSFPCSIL